MTDELPNILPCPHCQCTDAYVNITMSVECDTCAMRGPWGDCYGDAIEKWNSLPRQPTIEDDPSNDATDFAHPAWWRGHDHGFAGAVRMFKKALTEKPAGVVADKEAQELRVKIWELAEAERSRAIEQTEEVDFNNPVWRLKMTAPKEPTQDSNDK